MILWVAGRSAEAGRAVAALEELLARLPFFPGCTADSWSAGDVRVAWVSHDPERYVTRGGDSLALWSGWPGAAGDDGRFARVRASPAGVEVECDPMGAYPVYAGGGWWSNNPELVRNLAGSGGLSEGVVASMVAGGWSLSGDPAWSGIAKLAPALAAADVVPMLGRGLDVDAAAADLVDATRSLMDWPGRPQVVPVTAGRDSRLVLAAATETGTPFSCVTGGRPGEADVDVGRLLARAAGADHALIPDDTHGGLYSHPRRAAELLTMTSGGTASAADAVGFPFGPRPGPLPIWHSGQGGEIARGYYARVRGSSRAELADSLYRVFAMRRPGRSEPLSDAGEALVRDELSAWVGEVIDAGAAPADVPDLFYLFKRMGTWAGPTHGAVEYVRDTTSPLWSPRMLPHLLALTAPERAREEFHLRLLERLSPELAALPGWPRRTSELARRAARGRELAGKVARELRRRARARRAAPPEAPAGGAPDPFAGALADIRELVLGQDSHPAWGVVDRVRAEELLGRDPSVLDEVSRYYVWRLATVFALPAS